MSLVTNASINRYRILSNITVTKSFFDNTISNEPSSPISQSFTENPISQDLSDRDILLIHTLIVFQFKWCDTPLALCIPNIAITSLHFPCQFPAASLPHKYLNLSVLLYPYQVHASSPKTHPVGYASPTAYLGIILMQRKGLF